MEQRPGDRPLARRTLLGAGAVGLGGLLLAGCTPDPSVAPHAGVPPQAIPSPRSTASAPALGRARLANVGVRRHRLPSGTLGHLPAGTRGIAWTVDDGIDGDVVAAYARFAADTGIRLTFFLNGIRASWTEHAALLRPMVRTGQVQIGTTRGAIRRSRS